MAFNENQVLEGTLADVITVTDRKTIFAEFTIYETQDKVICVLKT